MQGDSHWSARGGRGGENVEMESPFVVHIFYGLLVLLLAPYFCGMKFLSGLQFTCYGGGY